MARTLPAGVVTFVFTDIEGSTALLGQDPVGYRAILSGHNQILSQAWGDHGGVLVSTDGDGQFVAFEVAGDAVAACLQAQLRLGEWAWPGGVAVRVRMGAHTGVAYPEDDDYVSLAVNQAARVAAAAHGGQVLLSAECFRMAQPGLPAEARSRSLGRYQLKDFAAPEELHQLVHPSLAVDFPPPRAPLAAGQGLPRHRTSFVGRKDSLPLVVASVRAGGLTTLTGPGGTGKTRLAGEVAHQLRDQFPDGARFLELAGVSSGEVLETVAGHFGVRGSSGGGDLLVDLVQVLSSRSLLLVVDNCEHVLEPTADLVETLLDECLDIAILATSREALRVVGERVVALPTLDLPGQDTPWEDLPRYEAVNLFLERARLARPDFVLDSRTGPHVAAVCRRLDGLPLGLELAAAALRSMPITALDAALGESQEVLAGGLRRPSTRQRGLRELMDWSYNLLDERTRAVHRRLALLPGGFTLEMAQAVTEEPDVLPVLRSLVEKSLVTMPEGDPPRYRMLETIRDYARDQLAGAGETASVLTRQCCYFASILVPLAFDHRLREDYQRVVEREWENVRSALELPVGVDADDSWGELVRAAYPYWEFRGRSADVHRILDRIPALVGLRPGLHAELLSSHNFALLGWGVGATGEEIRVKEVLDNAEMALELSLLPETTPDERFVVLTTFSFGFQAVGLHDRAQQLLEEAAQIDPDCLQRLREMFGPTISEARGVYDFHAGNYQDAAYHYSRALAGFRAIGDRYGETRELFNLGEALDMAEGPGAGTDHLLAARRLAQEIGTPHGLCLTEQQFMLNAEATGNLVAAHQHATTILQIAEVSGLPAFSQRANATLERIADAEINHD